MNLGISYVFSQIAYVTRLDPDTVGAVRIALRSWTKDRIFSALRTSNYEKSFSESDDVVDLQLKKTTAFLELQVDVRRGVEHQAMLLQPDAQQVRAARLPLRLHWTRVQLGYVSTALAHDPTSPCSMLVMIHGCSPCAFQSPRA